MIFLIDETKNQLKDQYSNSSIFLFVAVFAVVSSCALTF